MEEKTLNMDFQDTTPEYDQEETTNIDDAEDSFVTPNEEEPTEEGIERDTKEDLAQDFVSEKTEEKPFVTVQYNHKNRDFTKQEAINFIQKGMHTEALRSKLEYVATLQGTDINSLVEKIVKAPEEAYRRHLESMYGKGSEDVEIGMKIYREKQAHDYKKIVEEKREEKVQSVYSRLADEYMALKSEIPDAPEYSQLPDSVILEAAEGKKDLYSAYLCHLYKEKQKIDDANRIEEKAMNASGDSMKSISGDNISSEDRNFLSGLWQK